MESQKNWRLILLFEENQYNKHKEIFDGMDRKYSDRLQATQKHIIKRNTFDRHELRIIKTKIKKIQMVNKCKSEVAN